MLEMKPHEPKKQGQNKSEKDFEQDSKPQFNTLVIPSKYNRKIKDCP
jgi:hypothetical protein